MCRDVAFLTLMIQQLRYLFLRILDMTYTVPNCAYLLGISVNIKPLQTDSEEVRKIPSRGLPVFYLFIYFYLFFIRHHAGETGLSSELKPNPSQYTQCTICLYSTIYTLYFCIHLYTYTHIWKRLTCKHDKKKFRNDYN
jgi:hypothetical protein